MKKFREFRRQLGFFGRYRSGRRSGVCWEYRQGGGYLVGEVSNDTGEFTGDGLAYLYPDLATALVGEFAGGVLVSGAWRSVEGVRWVDGGIPAPTFGPARGEAVPFSRSTRTSVGACPLVPDPYESAVVECRTSGMPGAGEGLFARVDLLAGTVAAFYNGVRIPYALGGPKEEWATSGYKIFVNADFTSGERMDIPEDCVSLSSYRATLGHKVNHSFVPNCSEWFFDHPRFGVVPCERTVRDVRAGEELTLDYEYDPFNAPEWFTTALERFVAEADDDCLELLNPRYTRYVRHECGIRDFKAYVFEDPSKFG